MLRLCTHTTINVVNRHWQEYQHHLPGKSNRIAWSTLLGAESKNHHYRGHSSGEKHCKDNTPRGNRKKRSKINLAKYDLKNRTSRNLFFQHC
jgi:hypothetical protein